MPTISVATINLTGNEKRWLERRQLLVAQIMDAAPDLISLQEINMPSGQGLWLRNQLNVRISGKSNRPYRLIQKRRRHLVNGFLEGIGILSKMPVLYHDSVSLGYGGRLALRASVELTPQQNLDFVAVHLHPVSYSHEAREEQVLKLCGWLDTRRSNPMHIVAGDYSEVPTGPAVQYMKRSYRSAYAEKFGREPLATFPTALSEKTDGWTGCLDYIFLSPAAGKVTSASLFCDAAADHDDSLYPSDHVGLIATLAL